MTRQQDALRIAIWALLFGASLTLAAVCIAVADEGGWAAWRIALAFGWTMPTFAILGYWLAYV